MALKGVSMRNNSNRIENVTIGSEIRLSTFYKDIKSRGISWTYLDDSSRKLIKNICEMSYTSFAYELRAISAAFAVVSTDPHVYRNPFTKFMTYRRSKAADWIIILLEMYINEANVWDEYKRIDEVHDMLKTISINHKLVKYLEDRIDMVIENHYLGGDSVDYVIKQFAENPRTDWVNKVERVKGEVIALY